MEILEVSAKTVDEAVKKALEQLGAKREDVEITVINEGKGGILGLGSEQAKIVVKILKSSPSPANLSSRPVSDVVGISEDILESLLKMMEIKANIDRGKQPVIAQEEEDNNTIAFNITGEDLGVLIGRKGQTLASLQYIVRLITAQKTGTWLPIVIDVEGYKQRRYEALQALAHHIALQVRTKKVPFKLEPMPAYERRIIHLTLANDPEVITQSIGEGEMRKVTVLPREQG